MDIVGFAQEEKQSLFTLLSAILNLGNVTFDEVFDQSTGHDTVTVANEKCKLFSNSGLHSTCKSPCLMYCGDACLS